MKPLRDYQSEDVGKIFEEWKECKSTLYVAATGLGKTRLMVEVAHRTLPKRTILLAHRTELINQAREAFLEMGMESEVEKAELTASTNLFTASPVVIASVQTMLSGNEEWTRMRRFDPKDFGLLLYDECHHGISPGNKKIVDYFTNGNSELRVLGVTATPDRADEEALGQIFETVASERDILWATENGWLVPIAQRMVNVDGLDFSEMRTTCGDLNSTDLAAVMEQESCVQGVVQPTLESLFDLEPNSLSKIPIDEWRTLFSERKPTHRAIVFTVSVLQAEMLSNVFNRVLPDLSAWICGKTRDEERQKILTRFAGGGDKHILVNVGVTTEGYDNPAVDIICMARPTKSRSLYAQCIGRATRPVPGLVDRWKEPNERRAAMESSDKPLCLVLDFVGNSGKHKLMTSADILGGKNSDAAIERAVKNLKTQGRQMVMTQALAEAEKELLEEREKRRIAEEARKARVVAKSKYTTTMVNPFDVFQLEPARERGWDKGRQLSEKQMALLRKQGIDASNLPYAQAKQLIDNSFYRWNRKLCTFKQAKLLQRNGIDPKNVTMKQATVLIDRIAANHWKPLGQDVVQTVMKSNDASWPPKPENEHEPVPF